MCYMRRFFFRPKVEDDEVTRDYNEKGCQKGNDAVYCKDGTEDFHRVLGTRFMGY